MHDCHQSGSAKPVHHRHFAESLAARTAGLAEVGRRINLKRPPCVRTTAWAGTSCPACGWRGPPRLPCFGSRWARAGSCGYWPRRAGPVSGLQRLHHHQRREPDCQQRLTAPQVCTVSINLIPHTVQNTCSAVWRLGHAVNLEIDTVARCVERMLAWVWAALPNQPDRSAATIPGFGCLPATDRRQSGRAHPAGSNQSVVGKQTNMSESILHEHRHSIRYGCVAARGHFSR